MLNTLLLASKQVIANIKKTVTDIQKVLVPKLSTQWIEYCTQLLQNSYTISSYFL